MKWIQWPFRCLIRLFRRPLVKTIEAIKHTTGLRTYQIEVGFIFLVLFFVWFFTGRTVVEAVGAFAVLMTFQHASVANRLEERQAYNARETGTAEVECYQKLGNYFLLKEATWLIYFIALNAWSALVGVFLFLLYYPWREVWREAHPLK